MSCGSSTLPAALGMTTISAPFARKRAVRSLSSAPHAISTLPPKAKITADVCRGRRRPKLIQGKLEAYLDEKPQGAAPKPSAKAPAPTPAPSGGTTITITATGVSPKSITVSAGSRVTFVNNDTRVHDMNSDPHPEHTDCPEINQVGFLASGQSRQTGNLNTTRTCGFHDHDLPQNTSLQGSIVIQ